MYAQPKTCPKSFRSDERGGIGIMFGVSAMVITMLAGVAIDFSRVNHERTRVATSLDAAALAAGKALLDGRLSDGDVEKIARGFFNQNMAVAERFGKVKDLSVNVDRATSGVTVTANVEVPMTITRIAGFDKFEFPVSASTSFEQNDVELSVALDVTGSMAPAGKLDALKSASNDLFDILLPDGGTPNKVRIALAPYSSGVNAGTYATAATGGMAPRNCTFERDNPNQANELAPTPGNYLKMAGSPGVSAGAQCPGNARIVPLTDDKAMLRASVQSYTPGGSTAGHLGTQWAWYMISPEWKSIFTGNAMPVDYSDKKTKKAMILMTDGLFNTIGGKNDGDTSPSAAKSQKLAVDMCKAMRDKGVVVYTVGFKLADISSQSLRDKATQTLLDCAGSTRNFFDAANGEDLRDAFKAIAEQINNLRLTN